MKTLNKFAFAFTFSLVFTILSCEKENIVAKEEPNGISAAQPLEKNGIGATQEEVLKPFAVSKTYKVGKTIEELGIGSSKARIGLLTTNNAWSQVTKENVRAAGISDTQVFGVIKDEFFRFYQPPGGDCNCVTGYSVTTVGFGPTDSKKYGSRPNPFLDFPNFAASEWRFYGEGTVSQNTGFGAWKKVSFIEPDVRINTKTITADIGGEVWLTSAKSTAHQATVSGSVAVTAGGKIGIPLVAEGEASLEVTVGASYTFTREKTWIRNFYYPVISVPKGKSVRYQLEERWVPVKTAWKFPIQFRGSIAAEIGTVYTGQTGGSITRYENIRVNANSFNNNYDQPSKYHTMNVEERFSKEFRVSVYKVDW